MSRRRAGRQMPSEFHSGVMRARKGKRKVISGPPQQGSPEVGEGLIYISHVMYVKGMATIIVIF